jgi:hypothetical protein
LENEPIYVLHIALRFKPEVVDVQDDAATLQLLEKFIVENRDALFPSQVCLLILF